MDLHQGPDAEFVTRPASRVPVFDGLRRDFHGSQCRGVPEHTCALILRHDEWRHGTQIHHQTVRPTGHLDIGAEPKDGRIRAGLRAGQHRAFLSVA